ncbi:MAG: class I tRNA ligase family protein [Candidatus Paceibacterota bacterium]|jgi:methionyl-tRNA synthetase
MKRYYITTSIVYTNACPHIGFALELAQADVLARYHRLQKEDVRFLTGTDENGVKNKKTAEKLGITTSELVNENSAKVLELTKTLNISNDDFIRTTDKKRHWPGVEKIWKTLEEKGDIYKKTYDGLYCAGCEAFITKKDLDKDGKCHLHNAKPEEIKEKNYFFKLSKYGDEIKKLIESGKLKIIPEIRTNELFSLIKDGVQDVSFSRPASSLDWGIPVPSDNTQTIYVWADALTNYISSLGFGSADEANFNKYWPADIQIIGKDILRFHALIWPGILLSAGLSLPNTLLVHGFISSDGQKMSKTLGNVVSPFEIIGKYGTDALRYYLLKEIPTTGDGDFTYERFNETYNADLASGLGNLVSRVVKMIDKYCDNKVPQISKDPDTHPLRVDDKIHNWKKAWQDIDKNVADFKFNEALFSIWQFIAEANKYIDKTEPWALARRRKTEELNWALYGLLDAIHQIAWQIYVFMPETALKIAAVLDIKKLLAKNPKYKDSWTNIKPGTTLRPLDILFPRFD